MAGKVCIYFGRTQDEVGIVVEVVVLKGIDRIIPVEGIRTFVVDNSKVIGMGISNLLPTVFSITKDIPTVLIFVVVYISVDVI